MSGSSIVKAVLWLANILLAFFIAAMTVTPQAAAANVAMWLGLLGLKSGAGWVTTHAAHHVHFSRSSIPGMSEAPCTAPCRHPSMHSSGYDVPEVVLYAAGALLVGLAVIWLLRRRGPTLRTQLGR